MAQDQRNAMASTSAGVSEGRVLSPWPGALIVAMGSGTDSSEELNSSSCSSWENSPSSSSSATGCLMTESGVDGSEISSSGSVHERDLDVLSDFDGASEASWTSVNARR